VAPGDAPPRPAAAPPVDAGALSEYAAKRDFSQTAEPAAVVPRSRTGPLVFAVQKHDATRLHYDLRLELDGVLKSWAVPNGPSLDPAEKRLAVQTEDHPMEYATWEGVIPRGQYGAGEMIVWDRGSYAPEAKPGDAQPPREEQERRLREGLAKGKLALVFNGQRLRGTWMLVRTSRNPRDWLLIKKADQHAAPGRDVLAEGSSVLSGLTIEQLRAGKRPAADAITVGAGGADRIPGARPAPFPGPIAPMMAAVAERPFSSPDWLFEPKLDGYRVIAAVRDGQVRLWSRRGLDCTRDYPGVVEALGAMGGEAVFDGEVVALDEHGRPSFDLLKQRLEQIHKHKVGGPATRYPLVYYAFDLLYHDGLDLRGVPLERRKVLLLDALSPSDVVRPLEALEGDGVAVYEAALALGLEGLVAKHRRSLYESGRRSPHWLKLKGTRADELVIGGYTEGKGARADTIGALLLGQYDGEGRLRYVGHAGSGFDERTATEVRRKLDALRADVCPFEGEYLANSRPTWVRPELVAEVKFAEWTSDHKLRAPVFVRLREDKAPEDAVRAEVISPLPLGEGGPGPGGGALPDLVAAVLDQLARPAAEMTLEVGERRLKLTNLDKRLWPDFTKRDLLVYLARVSPWYLPHLADRPLTLIRMPEGIDGPRFYQKHPHAGQPEWIETVVVYSDHNVGNETLLICQELATLLWLGQMGALELHSWYSRTRPEPDGGEGTRDFADSLDNMRGSLLNHPDYVVFDLDPVRPDEKAAPAFDPRRFANVRRAALWLKEALDGLGLPALVKTSGRSGLHVYVPIARNVDFDLTRAVSQTIAQYLKQHHPREIALEWAVAKRVGEVFVDTNQNVRGKTLASVYSPRAAPWGSVSMPLRWDEVETADPRSFTIATAPARLAEVGDVWADWLARKADLRRQLGVG
jgi:bifunctional non-homologous end joining protein LigD